VTDLPNRLAYDTNLLVQGSADAGRRLQSREVEEGPTMIGEPTMRRMLVLSGVISAIALGTVAAQEVHFTGGAVVHAGQNECADSGEAVGRNCRRRLHLYDLVASARCVPA
jgi:hypothetical protein